MPSARRGYYEKELFPGGQSYGPSRVMRFTPYTLKVAAGWAFTPRRYIEIAAAAAAPDPLGPGSFLSAAL